MFLAEIFTEFSRHLDQNLKKRTKRFGLKEKIRKITQFGQKISVQEKKVTGKCACCVGSKFIL